VNDSRRNIFYEEEGEKGRKRANKARECPAKTNIG